MRQGFYLLFVLRSAFIGALLFLVGPLMADQRAPFVIGAAEFRPQAYFEDGQLVGLNIDIWRVMFKEAGLNWEGRFMPSRRIYHSLTLGKGSIDGWVTFEVEGNLMLGAPVKPSLFPGTSLYLFARAGAERQDLATLETDALIVIIGYKYDGLLAKLKARLPETLFIAAPDHKAAFLMLEAGRANYVLDYKSPGFYFAEKAGVVGLTHTEVFSKNTFFFISHNVADQAALLKRLSAASVRIIKRMDTDTDTDH